MPLARSRRARLGLLLVVAVLIAPAPPTARAAPWRWPVRGPIAEAYHYREATPFTRGQRRGIVIAAPAGAAVRAACAGRVTFAGQLAGRAGHSGHAVSVVCGTLTATYLRLGSLAVRRGSKVDAGDRLGTLGARGLHLGARRTGRRWAYVDPLGLLGDDPAARPMPPLPTGRWRAGPARPAPPARRAAPARALAPARPAPATDTVTARSIPLTAWLGLALLAASVPTLGLVGATRRRRQGRRQAPEAAPARAGAYAPSDAA